MKGIAKTHEQYLTPDLASGVVVVRGPPERVSLEGNLKGRGEQMLSQWADLSRQLPGEFTVLNGTNVQHASTTTRYQSCTYQNTNGCGLGVDINTVRTEKVASGSSPSAAGTFTFWSPSGEPRARLRERAWKSQREHRDRYLSSGSSQLGSHLARFCRKAECLLPLQVGGIPPFYEPSTGRDGFAKPSELLSD